ncbi:MAG: L,D-transpeptidase family protein [Anaerolineales bacterium]|nr:L,D-transpeptidase family protein [Anaerolineales bacterium]
MKRISRRDFLKLSGLALGTLAFRPVFPYYLEEGYGEIARIAVTEIDLYAKPNDESDIIGKRYRDQLVHVYDEITSSEGPSYNPLWYKVWGGYLHSAHIQKVKVQLNEPLSYIPDSGQLAELTVPYSPAYQLVKGKWSMWNSMPIYYETTHWVTGIVDGPDHTPWYEITSELTDTLSYYLPAAHLRPIPDEEISPLSPDVPIGKKRIEISVGYQTLKALEYNEVVFSTRVSTGIRSRLRSKNGIPTETPKGKFNIYSKMPNKHMGSVSGNPDDDKNDRFSLPGVPWTCFFTETGVALHGTYWHNNFGIQMSHGCVNMRNEDAKWIFRWTTPTYTTPIKSRTDWEQKGMGTPVIVT